MQLTTHHPETHYLQVTGNLPTDLPPGTFVSVNRNPPLKIYHLGFQPAKSIPEIPSWFLHKYATLPFTVLDPFAGSGTTIGTERIPRQEYQTLGKTGNSRLDQLIEDIYTATKYQATPGQNPLRARVVYQYFMDMKSHFASSFKRLREGGYYCFTVGDMSKICGVDIPVANLLTELASEMGFRPEFHFHLLLKNRRLNIPRNVQWAGTIKHDTTVVLRKPLG